MADHHTSFDPRTPFTRAEGLRAGLTDRQLTGPGFVRLHRNLYISRSVPRTLVVRARAAIRVAPQGAVVSHHTAAALWGGAVPSSSVVHLTVRPRQVLTATGLRGHQRASRPAETRRQGVPVTTPEQTFLDMAGQLDLVELVVLGDRLVRRKATTTADLVKAAAAWSGWFAGVARRAAGLVRPGVDSPPESRLRMLVVLAGLPEPVVNHKIVDSRDGTVLRRFELAYPELRIAIEYEGREHRANDDVWAADITRREELDRGEWRIVQVISPGLYESPLRTLQRIDQARADRGAPATRLLLEGWRRYFPGTEVA